MPVRKSRKRASKRVISRISADEQTNLYSEFKRLDFESVFDVLSYSKSNFIHLYDEKLNGKAEAVYEWAMYYVDYIAHAYREGDDLNKKEPPLLLATKYSVASDPAQANDLKVSEAKTYTTDTLEREQVSDLDVLKSATYRNLFPIDQKTFVCHPDSIRAQTSPVAYLLGLYQFVKKLGVIKGNESLAGPIKKLFEERRPDLESLCLSEKNVRKAIPGLDLVNNILSEAIKKNITTKIPDDQSLDEFLAYSVYPFELPFYLPYMQILKSLDEKKLVFSTIIQQLQKAPYFLNHYGDDSLIVRNSYCTHFTPTQIIVLSKEDIPHHSVVSENDSSILRSIYLIAYYDLHSDEEFLHHIRIKEVDNQEIKKKILEKLEHSYGSSGKAGKLAIKLEKGEELSSEEQKFLDTKVGLFTVKGFIDQIRFSARDAVEKELKADQEQEEKKDEIYNINYLTNKLRRVPYFLKQTGLTRDALDQLLSLKQYAPKLSKYVGKDSDIKPATPAVYGSSYINSRSGNELTITGKFPDEKIDGGDENGCFFEVINRFIRFQKYTAAKPNELDWLIKAADFYKGKEKKDIINAVSAFGFFCDLQSRYSLNLEEFTALIYQICPYSIGDELSQFDRLFNANIQDESSALVLDGSKFDIQSDNVRDQQTIQRLCSGLNIDRASFQFLATWLVSEKYSLTRSLQIVSVLYRVVRMARLFGLNVFEFIQLITGLSISHLIKDDTYGEGAIVYIKDLVKLLVILDQLTTWMKAHQLTAGQLFFILDDKKNSSSLVATPQAMNLFNELEQGFEREEIRNEDQACTILRQAIIKIYHVEPALAANLIRWTGNDFVSSLIDEFKKIKDTVMDQSSLQKEGHKFLETLAILERHIKTVTLLNLNNTELQLLNEHPEYFVEPVVVRTFAAKADDQSVYHESISKLHSLDPGLANNLAQLISKEFIPTVVSAEETQQEIKQPAPLTFRLLYLLTRLKDWLALSSEPEENVLSYFRIANAASLDDKEKKHCTELLAESLRWDRGEVEFLFSKLTNKDKVAKTMSNIDWICRVKALCVQTGLSAEQLLKLSAVTMQENSAYHEYAQLAEALQTVKPLVSSIN